MNARYIALAIPFFFVLIGIELAWNKRKGDARYRYEDSITNLSCGVGQQVIGLFIKGITLAGYVFLYERYRFFSLSPTSVVAWVALTLGVDVAYYWFHRASHRVNFLWAGHVVHHQSEEYNLSVALRQSWFGKLFEWIFYLPLALLGFSPLMFLAMTTLNTLYQFWIHTRSIGKLGPLEWVLNTPSHHRVHHGIDPKYIDKNYAGVLIVWDRIFGTFQEEIEEPTYGIVKPLASWNPLWANVHYWVEIASLSRSGQGLEKLYAWVAPPEWRPKSLGGKVTVPEVDHAHYRKYDARGGRRLGLYVTAQFAFVSLVTSTMLWFETDLPRTAMAIATALVFLTLVSWGALFEHKPWAFPFELTRLVLAGAALGCALAMLTSLPLAIGAAAAMTIGLLAWLSTMRRAPNTSLGQSSTA